MMYGLISVMYGLYWLNCKTGDLEITISVLYGLQQAKIDFMTFIFLCHIIATSAFHLTWHFAMWRCLRYYDK